MRNIILILLAMAFLAGVSGCGSGKDTLHIYTWIDYIDPELVKEFEKKNACKVSVQIFDSNEAMLEKVLDGAEYDLIFPSSYMIEIMRQKNLLEKIDKTKIPNLKNIDPLYAGFAIDSQMTYGVPYMISYAGIAYRSNRIQSVERSWSVFADRTDLFGRMTLLDDMRQTLGAALVYNGCSINTTNETELLKAKRTVLDWKKNIAKFESEQYRYGISDSEFLLVHTYNGDIGQAQKIDPGIVFFFPREGFTIACEEMVIPQNARNKDLAYQFIDFIHDGKNAARNITYTAFWCPNTAANEFLSAEILNNPTIFPNPSDIQKGEVIGDVGDALPLYHRIWDEIKAAR